MNENLDLTKLATIAENMPKVYESGQNETSLAHWKAITRNGKRTEWDGGYTPFMYTDYSDIKFPKPIVITGNAKRLFRLYKGAKLPRKEDIDMTGVTAVNEMFSFIYGISTTMEVPDYGIPTLSSYTSTYQESNIKKIELIRVTKDTTFSSTFGSCRYLAEVYFEGEIGQSISFSSSPLTVECVVHILQHLYDYSGTSDAGIKTLTLADSVKTRMAEQGAMTELDGMTYDAYISSKGWTLA